MFVKRKKSNFYKYFVSKRRNIFTYTYYFILLIKIYIFKKKFVIKNLYRYSCPRQNSEIWYIFLDSPKNVIRILVTWQNYYRFHTWDNIALYSQRFRIYIALPKNWTRYLLHWNQSLFQRRHATNIFDVDSFKYYRVSFFYRGINILFKSVSYNSYEVFFKF